MPNIDFYVRELVSFFILYNIYLISLRFYHDYRVLYYVDYID